MELDCQKASHQENTERTRIGDHRRPGDFYDQISYEDNELRLEGHLNVRCLCVRLGEFRNRKTLVSLRGVTVERRIAGHQEVKLSLPSEIR